MDLCDHPIIEHLSTVGILCKVLPHRLSISTMSDGVRIVRFRCQILPSIFFEVSR